MTGEAILTLGILGVALTLMVSERLRADIVALLVVVSLGATGILTTQEAFGGFSRSAVITITAIFIIAEGLRRSGLSEQAGRVLLRISGTGEARLVVVVMLAGAGLSLFMNNIAAASILLPAVTAAARKAGVSPSKVLMPLAFGTILGGMATLLTTANILASGLLRSSGASGFGLLDFAPVGLPVVAIGTAYMALVGRRLLAARSMADQPALDEPSRASVGGDLVGLYRLSERLFQARVPPGSFLSGKRLSESTLRETYGLNVVAIERGGEVVLSPPPEATLREGDVLVLEGRLEEFLKRDVEPYLEILPRRPWQERDLASASVVVVEAMLSPRSGLIGTSLRQSRFREKYGMTVLGIWRQGGQLRTNLADLRLQFGDALLVQGPRGRLPLLGSEPDLILLSHGQAEAATVGKGRVAGAILVVTLGLGLLWPELVGEIMLGGALAMVIAGLLSTDQAYQAIEWKTVVLVAGMLPAGMAMVKTGAASWLAEQMVDLLGPAGPLAVLAGLFVLTVLMTQVMNGAAVTAFMAPLALEVGMRLEADPRAFVMGTALAASMAFLTPLGHPVNALVMGPGGYRFRDYFKVGWPLMLGLFAVVMVLLPMVWPLAASR